MSDLETGNEPHMRPMMHDEPIVLEPIQQKLLARWAVLKAIVIEAANRKRAPFYGEAERDGLKPPLSFIPVGTSVWIGRLSGESFHAGGTEIWRQERDALKAVHGCVTTIIVGHLVIQVVTVHVLPISATSRLSLECNPGAWDVNLLNIWPVFGARKWPPPVTFTYSGSDSIAGLITRWNLGENIA
jgi:hypothetical protein